MKNQLAEYMNMSRTPVREAIRRLEAEGNPGFTSGDWDDCKNAYAEKI